MQLSDKAMLVSLTVRQWTARRLDRKITDEVHKQHEADKNAGRYNKCLIDVEDKSFRAVQAVANESRTYLYESTLPWAQEGARILPSANYFDFIEKMGAIQTRFDQAVKEFIKVYPALKEQAKRKLNGMYREADYPQPAEIAYRYDFRYTVLPLPDSGDFRVKLGDGEVSAIRKQIEEQMNAATESAMRDLWNRLYEPVKHMATKLSDPKAKFHDSLVGNVAEIVELLPRLNLTDDKELEALRKDVQSKLAGHAPTILRADLDARADVAAQASDIAKRMAALMGA